MRNVMDIELLITLFGLGGAIMVNSIAVFVVSRRVARLESINFWSNE